MRQPYNIHVFLYHVNQFGIWEYAMFQRADDPKIWQGISGGVEDEESFEQAAAREVLEEAGIVLSAPLYRLDTISFLPADVFTVHDTWGVDTVVCPMVHFAVSYGGDITLSDEHLAVKWCAFDAAYSLMFWHDQKTALWELNQRLLRGNLIR
jgi:dihydroneopterin triphosphate diphosphatase